MRFEGKSNGRNSARKRHPKLACTLLKLRVGKAGLESKNPVVWKRAKSVARVESLSETSEASATSNNHGHGKYMGKSGEAERGELMKRGGTFWRVAFCNAHAGVVCRVMLLALLLGPAALRGVEARGIPPKTQARLTLPMEAELGRFTTAPALNGIAANSVTAIVSPPGETNRIFVLDQFGIVNVISNLAQPVSRVFLDLSAKVQRGAESGLLGLAFHPGFQTNGWFFIYYTTSLTTSQGTGTHDRLSRFSVDRTDPNRADPTSETPLITQLDPDPLHNAGDIHFGPDGYLYLSLGDGGGGLDVFNNTQRIDKHFFSGIVRIDVDNRPENLPPNPHPASSGSYRIPRDNPFLATAEQRATAAAQGQPLPAGAGVEEFNGYPIDPMDVRTEFYAVGLRNPWRFSFDPATGDLYCNDTGQDSREEVNLIKKGGNYGWAFMEGSIPGPKYTKMPDGIDLIPPLAEYEHTQGRRAIVASLFYRGSKYPELDGAYLFSDVEGDIGVIRNENGVATPIEWIAFSRGIATFGLNPDTGDILMSDGINSILRQLNREVANEASRAPELLSQTGIYSDLKTLTPATGVVPYSINDPFWSDNAIKSRWFALMDGSASMEFNRSGNWNFPPGMVWIKHFDMEMTAGNPASRRRLETRVMIRGANDIHGLTYRWNAEQTDAALVPLNGSDELLEIQENGKTRLQLWHYPSRKECLACHTSEGGLAPGFNTAQLNLACDCTGANQIAALREGNYFSNPPASLTGLRVLARPDQEDWSLEYRVRSYLASNCSQCHQGSEAKRGFWDARITPPIPQTGLIHGPVEKAIDGTLDQLIVPGHPERSVLFYRISTPGPHRMPPLGSAVIDSKATNLVARWIRSLETAPSLYDDWAKLRLPNSDVDGRGPDADPDGDGESNYEEFLTGQNPAAGENAWRIEATPEPDGRVRLHFPRTANRLFRVEWTTALSRDAAWITLDQPGNELFVASETREAVLWDLPTAATTRFYRVRIFQP